MHRCVYLTIHITKLQLQTTFSKPLYIPHFTGCWKSWCLHCLWPVSAHIRSCMSSGIVWRIYVGFVANIDIKILEVHPLGPGMPFLDSDTCTEGGGGGGLFIYVRVFFPVWCHPWMDDGTDRWMDRRVMWWKKIHKKQPQHLLLYLIGASFFSFGGGGVFKLCLVWRMGYPLFIFRLDNLNCL